jgi:maleylpyruvate isomerase
MSESAGPHSVGLMMDRIDRSVDRVLRSASALSDQQVREPSLLPGWSRGHVLTHIARNADGLRNLLIWARTGIQTPQYASMEVRDKEIELGAGRFTADIASSALAFMELARELPDDSWLAQVRGLRGPAHPAWFTLSRRLSEVEIHHADLDAGYRPSDWPDWFVTDELYRVTGALAQNPDAPAAVLNDALTGRQYLLRAEGTSELAITGSGYALLAWLLGRSSGDDLTADPAGPAGQLPSVPAH